MKNGQHFMVRFDDIINIVIVKLYENPLFECCPCHRHELFRKFFVALTALRQVNLISSDNWPGAAEIMFETIYNIHGINDRTSVYWLPGFSLKAPSF
jgi:hypothetical protein